MRGHKAVRNGTELIAPEDRCPRRAQQRYVREVREAVTTDHDRALQLARRHNGTVKRNPVCPEREWLVTWIEARPIWD